MSESVIEIEEEGEVENSDQPDGVPNNTPTHEGGSNKKNKGGGNSFKNNQQSGNKKGDNKQANNKNENNSKEQNNNNTGNSAKGNNNNTKKALGNSGDKNDQNFVKQMFCLVEGLKRGSKNYPLDSPVLFLLYRCGTMILCKVCLIVWYNLYFRDSIICVSSFNGLEKIEDYILNICLSYPYLKVGKDTKRFLLFYRWIPYVLANLLIMAYIPRLIIKWFNNSKLHHLLQDLSNASQWYENCSYKKLEEKLFKYFEENIGTHLHLYFVFVLNHVLAVSIVISFYSMLDYLLQGRFMYLPFDTIPIARDPSNFTDELSMTFPPFAKCLVAPPLNMKNKRSEEYNCHLTLMEFYEKFFYIFWCILFCYMIVVFLTIIVLIILWMPLLNRIYLCTANKSRVLTMKKNYLLKRLSSGDVFALYLVKKRTSDVQFCSLVNFLYDVIQSREGKLYEEHKSKEDWRANFKAGLEDQPGLRNRRTIV